MIDWNVVITVFDERGSRLAKRLLAEFSAVSDHLARALPHAKTSFP